MSTYGTSERTQRKRPPASGLSPNMIPKQAANIIATAIGRYASGYGGGNNPALFYESAGVMSAAVLVGYIAFVFRAT